MSHQIYPESPAKLAEGIYAAISHRGTLAEMDNMYHDVLIRAVSQRQNPVIVAQTYVDLYCQSEPLEIKNDAFVRIATHISKALAATGAKIIRLQSVNLEVANG
jgi:hypothetical protein